MRKLTKEQIEAIQNQQAAYDDLIELSNEDAQKINEICKDEPEPTDYVRRYINAYKNKDTQ
jgi:hypothetical protein